MTLLMILLVLSLLGVLALLVREIGRDGYGRRPGPRSHAC
jgi:hypothetical protein